MHCLSVWWAIDHNPEKGWAIRLPNALHLLHAMWQFIACIVGTRFIASAGVQRGSLSSLAFAHEVVQTKFFRRAINDSAETSHKHVGTRKQEGSEWRAYCPPPPHGPG